MGHWRSSPSVLKAMAPNKRLKLPGVPPLRLLRYVKD